MLHPRILRCGHGLFHAADLGEAEQPLAIVFVAGDRGSENRRPTSTPTLFAYLKQFATVFIGLVTLI